MKVIKYGSIPEKPVYRETCYNCSTEIEFDADDGEVHTYRDLVGIIVKCPLCNALISKAI